MKEDLYEKIVGYIVENQDRFYRLAFSYVHNKEDALDVVQNAVCKALEHYEALKNEQAVKTWFYRILVNESILLLKKSRREVLSWEEPEGGISFCEQEFEEAEELYREINQLEENTQKIIKLRFYEEMSLREISHITGLNVNTVKAKLYRGLKLLKQNIQEVEI